MARTVEKIQAEIIAEKEATPELADLISNSKTAIWRFWVYVVATAIWLHEKFFDAYKEELEGILENTIVGTGAWYVTMLYKFQQGDTVVILSNYGVGYLIIDESKQIIKRAAYQELEGGVLLLKVAKENAGEIVKLTNDELTEVKGYVDKFKFAGTKTNVISEDADKLRAYMNIYYDAVIPLATMKANVEAAIEGYLAGLDFNGSVSINKLIDALQQVTGIEDVLATNMIGISTLGNTTFNRVYFTRSGYIKPDDTPGFTLNDTLTYIAQ